MSYEAYKSYFFSSATIIGIVHTAPLAKTPQTVEEGIGSRSISEAVGGCYYMYAFHFTLAPS